MEMTFGRFHFRVRKEGSHRLAIPDSSRSVAVDSDSSGSVLSFESGDAEISSTILTKPASSGKLVKIFSNMSFGSSADSNISSDSDSVDTFDFIDRSTSIREVFADLYDGVTNSDDNQVSAYHQVYMIAEASRAEPETSEAFDDLGNPYVDTANLMRGRVNVDRDLKDTFDNLDKFCLKLNLTKCSFGVPAGELLGFLVSARGIEPNPEKIQAIVTMRKPTKRVAALSRFVARLGEKALPFYALIKQGEKFEWNEEADRAFEDLKRTISTPPILVAPKEQEPLLLYIAATPQGIGRSDHDIGSFTGKFAGNFASNFISNLVDTIVANPGKPDSIRLLRVYSTQRFLSFELFGSTREHGDDLRQRPLQRQRRRNPSTAGIPRLRIDEFKRIIITRSVGWHELGSSDTPFICNAQYSSGEDNIDSTIQRTTRRTAHHQVYVANNTGNTRRRGDEDHTPRSSRRASFENSASNRDSDYTIADEEWAAARVAVLNNTPLPAGTSVGTLNAYRTILEKNREHLSKEQATLERRLSAADRSSERRRGSQGSASRNTQGAGKHRSRMSRLSEDDAREITSNLSKSFMTTDTAGMPRPKTVAGATANIAAYLINQRPEGSMAQAHRGALESLAILGNNLVPQKERTMVQASGSKHHARDARDEITQSRIDKARRRRVARKDDDNDSSDEDQEYDGELRGADCLSYKIRKAMPPKKFKPTPTDAAKYDGQQEPRSWIDDYLQTVILHKGNQIAAMQCLQLYLKDSARAWLRGLPKGYVKSWDDLVDAFVANFQATYKRPVVIEELRNCRQKQKESMRSYIGRFTKLLNAAEDVSVDRAIDAFSDGVQRESYIEELGRKKPKTITKLMEIANSWADGEDNVRRPRQHSDDENDDQLKHDSGGRRDRHKRRKNRNYDDNKLVAAGYADRQDDRDDRHDGNRNSSGNRGNYKPRQQRTPEIPYAEQVNAPCYLHSYVDSKDGKTKSSHLLRDCRQFLDMHKLIQQSGQQQLPPPPPPPPQHQIQQAQPHKPNEAFRPPRGQMSMIHRTGVPKREMKKLT
ncbi:hypothetical protein QYE76_041667 [Lolium multiflorum]|uniref:Retrotransposon gag domain-containing protein n=1 Tax=Lolium multiflorum TaxID=4521 RepID=A0AAD8TFF7_LOLMU|nr:hypothetical protein QYE76_041667 [Lolium multiflorum]